MTKQMKYIYQFVLCIIFLICISTKGYAQNINTNADNKQFIIGVNVEQMANKYLEGFELVRKNTKWLYGREYVYQLEPSQTNIFITIGIFPSDDIAERVALDYLDDISIHMPEGAYEDIKIGDRFWCWTPYNESGALTNIVFIKRNALIMMNSNTFEDLITLAKNIALDIDQQEPYITTSTTISSPVIESISINTITEESKDLLDITIQASDPNNEALEYQFMPGFSKKESKLNQGVTFRVDLDFLKESSNLQNVKVVAINGSNLISEISEIKFGGYIK